MGWGGVVAVLVLGFALSVGSSVAGKGGPEQAGKKSESGALPTSPDDGPRPAMRQIFSSMTYLLPRSIDPERFASPAERAGIMAEIDKLANSVDGLETHGRGRGAGFNFLSLSLAEDVEQIRMRYEAGDYDEARYFLIGSIQNCVTCHSRRPSGLQYPFAAKLTETVEMEALTLHEKALLYVVTRRFDEALRDWEKFLRDPSTPASQFEISGVLSDYLTISVRGTRQYPRARETMERFAKRDDLSIYLSDLVADWIESLRWLEAHPKNLTGLEQARERALQARALNELPGDRSGLVFDLAASGWLNEIADREAEADFNRTPRKLSNTELSEVFYLLGMIEYRSPLGFWIDESANHLEAAVRIDPEGPFAGLAFRHLEEDLVIGYGGFGVPPMPIDVWVRLEGLRKLVEPEAAGE
jgi:tetratricopeptide (TPR) repeat protein